MADTSQACVYLYRRLSSPQIRYVGRGTTPDRALQHTGGSHNEGLRALIESGDYALEVAGPYASAAEAALVEAALISALERTGAQAALTNLAPGSGPRFRPLGVPGDLAGRPLAPPLTLADIGRSTGGALLVRNSFGADLSDGRPRLDPLSPQNDVIVDNITRHWSLHRLASAWLADPTSRPRVLIGCAGPINHRYVPGALHIDTQRLCDDPISGVVPTTATTDLDAHQLRGRRISDARFAQGRHQHLIWVDATGTVRYGAPTGWTALD